MTQPSERLQKVFEIGDTLDLFPVMKDWTTEDLQALLTDIDEFSAASYDAIDEAWKRIAFKSETFFNPALSKDIDRHRDQRKMAVLTAMSEICSVAIFYLHERGVAVEA